MTLRATTDSEQRSLFPRFWSAIACGFPPLAVAFWAFWPLGTPNTVASAAPAPVQPVAAHAPRSLDLAAFRTPLWVAPPPPPPAPAPPAPPPPLKLQLVGIATDNGVRAALLFDPDDGRLLTVRAGESIRGITIERIADAEIMLRDGYGPRTLALRPDSGGVP